VDIVEPVNKPVGRPINANNSLPLRKIPIWPRQGRESLLVKGSKGQYSNRSGQE
jgi:hypothetical protein